MPFLVPNLLKLPVSLHRRGVLFAISPPVIRVARAPFLRAIQTHLAVFGVNGDLLPVILGSSALLAPNIATHCLFRAIR